MFITPILCSRVGQLSAGVFYHLGGTECRKAGLKPLQPGRGRQGQCRALSSRPRTQEVSGCSPSWPFTKDLSFSLDILNRQPVGFKVFASLDSIQEDCLASDLRRIPPPKWAPPTVLRSRPGCLKAGLSLDWDLRAEKICWHSSCPKTPIWETLSCPHTRSCSCRSYLLHVHVSGFAGMVLNIIPRLLTAAPSLSKYLCWGGESSACILIFALSGCAEAGRRVG